MQATLAEKREPQYRGLRMTVDEYRRLEEDGFRYELIDGVVCMSPSPTPLHQEIALRVASMILAYVDENKLGRVYADLDVHLGVGPHGGDLVYRPDIAFYPGDAKLPSPARLSGPPALVIEIVSGSSRRADHETKKDDYERCGVLEYWIIDPELRRIIFNRLSGAVYVDVTPSENSFSSEAVPGFVFDLAAVRRHFD